MDKKNKMKEDQTVTAVTTDKCNLNNDKTAVPQQLIWPLIMILIFVSYKTYQNSQ